MNKLFRKIKFWYWWKFIATDRDKFNWQVMFLGSGIMKDDKFVDVKNFLKK